MRFANIPRFGLVFVIALAGCGGPDADALVKESIQHWIEAAEALESIQDEATAREADYRLQELARKLDDLNQKAHSMGELSPEQIDKLQSSNHQASKKALDRVAAASRQAMTIPGGRDVVLRFNRAARKLQAPSFR